MTRPEKWAITGWISAGVVGMTAVILIVAGINEDGLGIALRATARTSAVLFSLAFAAASLFKLNRNPITTWLRKNRRYVGVGFAVSHFVHLGLIGWLATAFPDPFFAERGPAEFVGGGLAYLFLAAMTATSFDTTARWLGAKRWRLLHVTGGWYIWVIFVQRYVRTAVDDPSFIPPALLLIAVLVLRIWSRFAAKRTSKRKLLSNLSVL